MAPPRVIDKGKGGRTHVLFMFGQTRQQRFNDCLPTEEYTCEPRPRSRIALSAAVLLIAGTAEGLGLA